MIMPRHILALALIMAQGAPLLAQSPAPASRSAGVDQGTAIRAGRTPFAEIKVTALNAANVVMPKAAVRVRDTRIGRVTGTRLTDQAGQVTFRGVEAGNYVVELVGDHERVLAASQLITVDAGDAVSTTVKLPIKSPSLGGLLGGNVAAAAIVAATAAAAGVLSVQVGDCVSPPCGN